MDVVIQEILSNQDFLNVLPLLQQLLQEENNPCEDILPPETCIASWKKAQDSGYALYGAYHENRIVAGFGLTTIYDPISEFPAFRLNNLIVDPDFRGHGIGCDIMKKVESIVRKNGGRHLIIEVLNTNRKAASFYKKNGFSYICDRMIKDVTHER